MVAINAKVIYIALKSFVKRFLATRWLSVILQSDIFVYPKEKIPGKGHFIDLSNKYKFLYVPRWISSEKSDY